MTPGLAFFYGGMVQRKNVISTMLQSFICMGIVSVLWVVVGFSLAFGDSIGGINRQPPHLLHVSRRNRRDQRGPFADDSARALRAFSAQVRDHHARPHHRRIRGASAFFEPAPFRNAFQPLHLCAARALDVAPGRIFAQMGRPRFRGRNRRAHVGGISRARGRALPRSKKSPSDG